MTTKRKKRSANVGTAGAVGTMTASERGKLGAAKRYGKTGTAAGMTGGAGLSHLPGQIERIHKVAQLAENFQRQASELLNWGGEGGTKAARGRPKGSGAGGETQTAQAATT
jgi:hypothetical protein